MAPADDILEAVLALEGWTQEGGGGGNAHEANDRPGDVVHRRRGGDEPCSVEDDCKHGHTSAPTARYVRRYSPGKLAKKAT
jgi:hypothetical protein